jgi:hypothetical protein
MKTILAALCLLASALGQTVQITDDSPSGSPLTFKEASHSLALMRRARLPRG